MKNIDETLNEQAAALAEATAPAPARKADPKNLTRLLKRFDRAESLIADTEALKIRVEKEVNGVLESGDVADEKLIAGLAVKRGQLEMVPFKLAQLQAEREKLAGEIQEEFTACFIAFERQFEHVREIIYEHLESFLRPLMSDDFMAEPIIARWLLPYTKLSRQIPGVVGRIQHYHAQGNAVAAARELLASEDRAAEILTAAEKLTGTAAK